MNAWINIEVSPDDKEIAEIDRLEEALGNIPGHMRQIRELIARFETCHFKYQQHCRHIMESIAILQPVVDVSRIGSNHPRHSGNAWKNDTTGRSRIGHHYAITLFLRISNGCCRVLVNSSLSKRMMDAELLTPR